MAPKGNGGERSTHAQRLLRLAIQKRKKDKKEKEKAGGIPNDVQNNAKQAQPSSSAFEKLANLKAKRKHLSGKEYAQSRALASEIAHKPLEQQAEWLSQYYQKWNDKSAPKEEGETEAIVLPHAKNVQALGQNHANLEANIIEMYPDVLSISNLKNGQPRMIVISPAAMGIVNIHKACPQIKIAKLFAKHIKIAEQVEILKSTAISAGGCTPNRLYKLIESGALNLDKLKYIMIDVTLDAKQRTMFDIPEVSHDFWVLWKQYLSEKIDKSGVKIVLLKM